MAENGSGVSITDVLDGGIELPSDFKLPTNVSVEEEEQEEEQEEEEEDPGSEEEEEDPGSEEEEQEEEDPGEQEEEDDSLIGELQATLGLELEGEFEDSTEGLVKFVNAVSQKQHENQLKTIFSKFPDVGQLLQYRIQGGSYEDYLKTMNNPESWENIEVAEDDTATHERIIRANLKRSGFSDEDIQEQIDEFKEAGTTFSNAKRSLKPLQAAEKQEKERLFASQKEKDDARKARIAEENKQMGEILQSGNLKGFNIPVGKKQAFTDWMFKPGEDGKTLREKQLSEETVQDRLTVEYLKFIGFDIKEAVKTALKTKKAISLRDRVNSGGTASGGGLGRSSKPKGGSSKKHSIPSVTDLSSSTIG